MKNFFASAILSLIAFTFTNIHSQTVYPVRDATVNIGSATGDITWFPYTPVKETNGVFEIYYRYNYIPSKAISTDGVNWSFVSNLTSLPSGESIIKKDDTWYLGYHTHYQGNVYFNTSQSSDGLNFIPGTRRFVSGEDMSFILNNDSFYCYIRPLKPQIDPYRKIGLMKSADFVNWTPIKTILAVDPQDYTDPSSPDFRKQFYSMSVFKSGSDFWGLINVYRMGDNGQDNEQLPPYNVNEHTIEVQLVYSNDGINWQRTNDRKAFIPRSGNTKQSFGLPTVVNNKLYVYTIEADRRHTDYESANQNGRFFKIWRYQMNLSDLDSWKPPASLNLQMAIEGIMISSTQQNTDDSICVYLRKKQYPYNLMDSAKGVINRTTLKGDFNFYNIKSGSYYLVVKGKNFIETWSRNPVEVLRASKFKYNFTSSMQQAYGNNLHLVNGRYCVFSGDVDQSGNIELYDMVNVFNDSQNFGTGLNTDLNGDGIVDLIDVALASNNTSNFILSITPE
ncbi:MAG TPA: hypothetical protein PKA90_02660 [Ignavibacteria bacterium]|nr:hypothetical protein [Ignavibacteria bacterium]HMR39310.1 hypothetical protein [Ignavibacteria bacterium]